MNLRFLAVSAFASLFVGTACAQSPAAMPDGGDTVPPVQVMVLGVYHFSNPGQDLNNVETDNVLTDARQAELSALGRALAAFEPTVVAVESTPPPPYVDSGYAGFTEAMLASESNETVQIGYRVAQLAGLETVHGIDEQPSGDEPDYFPYGAVAAFAEREGRSEDLAALSDMSGLIRQFETYQETRSIPALLKLHNTGFMPDEFYWDIIGFGEGEEQPGAELAAYWFMRNAKIFNKLQQVTQPGDRVLVVYGSGHKAWLDELVSKTSGYKLVDPVPYLDRAMDALGAGGE